jgi:hypothetical protein
MPLSIAPVALIQACLVLYRPNDLSITVIACIFIDSYSCIIIVIVVITIPAYGRYRTPGLGTGGALIA